MAETAKKSRKSPARAARQDQATTAPVREARALRGLLPSLSATAAAALRGLFAAPQGWTLRDNGVLQFMPGRPAPTAQTFWLDAEGTRIGIALQAPADGGGMHWSDYQGRSRVLAWSLAHEAQLMRLSEAFGVVLTPVADPDEGAGTDEADALWLDFIVDEEPADGTASRMPALQGALRVPPRWTERLLERADPPYDDDTPALGRWRELGMPVSLQWRMPPLPFAEWSTLQPGDVLVVGRRSRPPQAVACAGDLAWPLAATAGGWRIDAPPRHLRTVMQETSPMNDTPPDAGGDTAGDLPADGEALARRLPVDVCFELGRSELRVGDVSALQPGYVFALAAPVEGANVTIRANGQAVGQGEVVAVGDTLGVRLLWWN
ncbi:type III secretion system cytoplasmic ring protein SctQ [Luteimonas saliphila]|uniref:type III secretion system cytoplasmic ring protein SctQ n=1 Tax=Luteimonas saliphila TaxID=2804919 RepID=UPI00192E1A22|nr:type III secretion system cytoplasmic ring protein SctQ [Luteimonas saliphila]